MTENSPKDYRWSGYGAAMAGQRQAKKGLGKVVAGLQPGVESLSAALAVYRMHLDHEGTEERETVDGEGKPMRGALRREAGCPCDEVSRETGGEVGGIYPAA